ncbi:HAMP domain-containing sensor histidine kinase [Actinoplanes sp. NPDC026623]|uniref:sensor histidine kinase n=1 Tax=Actinoplanes sp. NPDC026623 TaxID=3155610 RepID=UPI0033F2FE7C
MPTLTALRRRVTAVWGRLPLRIRLVAGFAAAMLLVLTAAGAFVYLRVQYALDLSLNQDLAAQAAQLRAGATTSADLHGDPLLPHGQYYQLLDTGNRVLASAPGLSGTSLLRPGELRTALRAPLHEDRGALLPISDRPLRILAVPLHPGAAPATGPAVALVAVRRDQRDEALRELIGQLALAQLAALTVASLVGYRLARAALVPVERYRTQAAQIAGGATGVRLPVPPESHDEVARLGRTLNDMLTALETALERERRFVADASHELRNPLTLLSAELELALRRTRSTTELEEVVRRAAADTQDLINLADTLLRAGTPADPARRADTSIDVTELLTTLTNRYRPTTDRPLHLQVAPGLLVHGNAAALGQILTNLLDNAVRHGGGPITVRVDTVDGAVRVVVHDDGPGIDPGFLPYATERFTRADTARTTPGAGLGLALVDTIVRGYGGQLLICSKTQHTTR